MNPPVTGASGAALSADTPAVADVRRHVLEALDGVIDPELDEPITELGFVTSLAVTAGGDVELSLLLPTPQCAPNFAFLMAADARNALRGLSDVRNVTVHLEDHYTGQEINDAIAGGGGFMQAFPGETEDDGLAALRELFQRKALTARQSRMFRGLLDEGLSSDQVLALCVSDLPADPNTRRCLELRRALAIGAEPDAPAFVLPDGTPLASDGLERWLRMARLVATSLEANGGICRSLLEFRRTSATEPEEIAR
jgi:metal-sulfur cluster biosynthetic enzyme